MAEIQTEWGYAILSDADAIPALCTPRDIEEASRGQVSADDARVAKACASVSAAIRDFCGWHIAPVLQCRYVTERADAIVYLPALVVQSVDRVTVDGVPVPIDDVEHKPSGLVRLRVPGKGRSSKRWGDTVVEYSAGVPSSAVSQVAAQIILNALIAPAGVRSESAGQVSLSYNQTGSGMTGGVSLTNRDCVLLSPYRVRRVR